ncbi:MAG: serine hydrolase domain-containing protein [Gemmatimonadota bacterium]
MPWSVLEGMLRRTIDSGATPGLVLAVGRGRQVRYRRFLGAATRQPGVEPMAWETLFDLASLTKVLATTLLVMKGWQDGHLDLDARLGDLLPSYYPGDKAPLTLRQLLVHAAGLPPFVRLCGTFAPDPIDPAAQRRQALDRILQVPLARPPGTAAEYSDLGLVLLGDLLEQLEGEGLDRLCERYLYGPLGLADTFFVDLDDPLPKARRPTAAFAATEECPWRGGVVRGEVHDENAYILRGVAGHAGLFSSAADLAVLAGLLAAPDGVLHASTVRHFTTRQDVVPSSSRALGWDTPSPGASCGRHLSPRAFGHTGFTGTSLWVDPESGLFIVLLSNRVHPTRLNTDFVDLRPAIHDAVARALGVAS